MDREQDILFLFLTSHGSRQHELALGQNGMTARLPRRPRRAAQGERHPLESHPDLGLLLRASSAAARRAHGSSSRLRADRTSFAARRERFHLLRRAYFKSAAQGRSFQHAFRQAEILVSEWDARPKTPRTPRTRRARIAPQMSAEKRRGAPQALVGASRSLAGLLTSSRTRPQRRDRSPPHLAAGGEETGAEQDACSGCSPLIVTAARRSGPRPRRRPRCCHLQPSTPTAPRRVRPAGTWRAPEQPCRVADDRLAQPCARSPPRFRPSTGRGPPPPAPARRRRWRCPDRTRIR